MKWYYLLHQLDTLPSEIQKTIYQYFFDAFYKDVYYILKDHSLTEDIIQESFMKVITTSQKYEVKNPSSWMKQVVRNHTIDYLKKVKKVRYSEEYNDISITEDYLFDNDSLFVEDEVEKSLEIEALRHSILELKQDYQLLIKLHYIDELSYKEIATTLNLSEPAVGQKLLRARKKLLKIFKRKWVNGSE